MSAMVAAEQLVNEGAVHTLSRLLLASTDGAVDDEGCRTSRNRRARVLMSTLLLGEVDDDGCALSTVPMLVDEDAVHLETEERGF